MLHVRICDTAAVSAEGMCSHSGHFPSVRAGSYNAGLTLVPARSIEGFGETSGSADYPVGVWRTTFGFSSRGPTGRDPILDDEVNVHVERS